MILSGDMCGENVIPKKAVGKLLDLREVSGAESLNPGCYDCHDYCIGESCLNHDVKYEPAGPDYFGEVVEKVLAAVR